MIANAECCHILTKKSCIFIYRDIICVWLTKVQNILVCLGQLYLIRLIDWHNTPITYPTILFVVKKTNI